MKFGTVIVPEEEVEVLRFNRDDGIVALMDGGGSTVENLDEKMPGLIRLIGTGNLGSDDCNAEAMAKKIYDGRPYGINFRQFEEKSGLAPWDYLKALNILDLARRIDSAKGKTKQRLEFEYSLAKKSIKGRIDDPNEIIRIRNTICRAFESELRRGMGERGVDDSVPIFAGGFMQILADYFVAKYFVLNNHPGDLRKHDLRQQYRRGARILVGDAWKPSAKALSARHDVLYTSIHQMTAELDAGPIFMRGYGLPIDYNYLESIVDLADDRQLEMVARAAQETLKYIGDRVIAEATFKDLFEGFFGRYKETGVLCYHVYRQWNLVPTGISINDHVLNNIDRRIIPSHGILPPNYVEERINTFYDKVKAEAGK